MRREEVEALLAACDEGWAEWVGAMQTRVSRNTLAALCRRWLAVEDAPVVQIGGADGLSCFISQFGKKSLPSMQGHIARIVPEQGEGDRD